MHKTSSWRIATMVRARLGPSGSSNRSDSIVSRTWPGASTSGAPRWIRASFAIDAPLRRYFLRDLVTYGAVAAVLVLVLGVAWISRNADSPIVEAAESWPIVGGWAKSLRDRYRAPESVVEEAAPEPEDVIIERPNVGLFEADIEAFWASLGGDPPLGSDPAPSRPLCRDVAPIPRGWTRSWKPSLEATPSALWGPTSSSPMLKMIPLSYGWTV